MSDITGYAEDLSFMRTAGLPLPHGHSAVGPGLGGSAEGAVVVS